MPDRVLACGIAAVALLILSLLLRGLLKLITLAIVLVLAAGIFWFLRDGAGTGKPARPGLLPHAWTDAAEHALDLQKARDAWQSVQAELAKLPATTRTRLAAGTDDARRIAIAKIEARVQKLRKEGNVDEAAQLTRLVELLREQK